jgi:hypothetical protein
MPVNTVTSLHNPHYAGRFLGMCSVLWHSFYSERQNLTSIFSELLLENMDAEGKEEIKKGIYSKVPVNILLRVLQITFHALEKTASVKSKYV